MGGVVGQRLQQSAVVGLRDERTVAMAASIYVSGKASVACFAMKG